MNFGKFSFRKKHDTVFVRMIYNKDYKAEFRIGTWECLKSTMPDFLNEECVMILKNLGSQLYEEGEQE